MIPIALPSASFFILLTAGFFAGLLLLGWGIALAISGRARRTVRKYWKTSLVLCLALAAPFSFYAWFHAVMWQVGRDIDRKQAALRQAEPAGRCGHGDDGQVTPLFTL